jgi:hypothetical protein
VRTRAWISLTLRFPIKTTDDDGGLTEFSNIAEGPQPASLFSIPSGYTKMDLGAMGGMGVMAGANPRGGAANGADVMAGMVGRGNLPPEAQAAMAAAMERAKGPATITGSGWEKTKGWVVNLTVNATDVERWSGERGSSTSTYTIKATLSVPLNFGTQAIEGPGGPGPVWTLLATADAGTPEANALPLTSSAEFELRVEARWRGNCQTDVPQHVITNTKGTGRGSWPVQQGLHGGGQGLWKLSGDLKTYDLLVSLQSPGEATAQTRIDNGPCGNRAVWTENKSETTKGEYGFSVTVEGMPLPSAVGTVSGSKKMPLKIGDRQYPEATVSWTITPIR